MLYRCREHGYTMHAFCPSCGNETFRPGPAKYSPEDAYGSYRRRLKILDRAKASRQANPEGSR
ncbi:MAG: nucleolar RNA-binding Nop10p family protein [Thermoplasmatota archaeon]